MRKEVEAQSLARSGSAGGGPKDTGWPWTLQAWHGSGCMGPPHLSSVQEDCLGRWLQRDGARGHQESEGAQIKRAGGPILGGVSGSGSLRRPASHLHQHRGKEPPQRLRKIQARLRLLLFSQGRETLGLSGWSA